MMASAKYTLTKCLWMLTDIHLHSTSLDQYPLYCPDVIKRDARAESRRKNCDKTKSKGKTCNYYLGPIHNRSNVGMYCPCAYHLLLLLYSPLARSRSFSPPPGLRVEMISGRLLLGSKLREGM